jgi:hypothetical protein
MCRVIDILQALAALPPLPSDRPLDGAVLRRGVGGCRRLGVLSLVAMPALRSMYSCPALA